MAVRKILRIGDETLRRRARPVDSFDKRFHTLMDDMAQTMYEADGAGLAAPQVGILRRAVVIDVGEGIMNGQSAIIESEASRSTPRAACPYPAARHREAPQKGLGARPGRHGKPLS
jgi:peptide deformylase